MANGNPGSVAPLGTDLGSDPYSHDPQQEVDAGVPTIGGDADFKAIPEGSDYFGPDKVKRTKPFLVDNDATYLKVPEGAEYMGPDGVKRKKPTYGDIGFTAEALHNMALTPEAKVNALKSVYGDRVKSDAAGAYVEDEDGKILRPGVRGMASGLGHAASEVLPAAGMTLGGLVGGSGGLLGGGAAGTAVAPGPGTIAGGLAGGAGGAFAGGTLGAMGGRQANNAILSLLGIHQPIEEQIKSMGNEGALTALGEPIGRGIGAVANAVRKVPEVAGQAASATRSAGSRIAEDLAGVLESFGVTPERARSFMGASEGTIERAKSVTDAGGRVPPSILAPDAPFLGKIEQFDAAFNKGPQGTGRFSTDAQNMYEREGQKIVTSPQVGGVVKESLTEATEKVSSKKAGEAAVTEARNKMAYEDADLERRINQSREAALKPYNEAGGAEGIAKSQQGVKQGWEQAYQSNIEAANDLIRKGVNSIRLEADEAMKEMAGRPGQSGDLVDNIANQFKSYNSVVRSRASHYYSLWDQAAGGKPVDVTSLADDAARFFSEMPEGLAGKYPVEIKLLNKLAAPEGEEAITMGAGELHHLRSWMRHGINYDDLTPTIREGAMKHFESKVNRILQGTEDSPLLNAADKFYRENIPYMDNEMIRATMRAIKGGTSIDPEVAANIFFKAGRAEDVREARKVLGPNLWNAVEAAHVQSLVNKSKSLEGVDAKKLAGLIEQDHQKGMLEMGYSGTKAGELIQIARDIQHIEGTLSVPTLASDNVATIMQKAQAAKLEADAAAKADPLKAFSDATKEFDRSAETLRKGAVDQRKQGPLGFLFKDNMPYKGAQAADKILSNEDNIVAAAHYFGQNSPTFDKLRQVYVQRFLQREFNQTGGMRAQLGHEVPEEVQQLMFPGVTKNQMVTLAKNMEFLFGAASIGGGGEIGGALAGASRVLNPTQHLPGMRLAGKIPGVDTIARYALGKYFATLMEGVSHPEFVNWLAKSLNGPPEMKLAAKAVLNDRMKTSGWLGAAGGQLMAAPSNDSQDRYAQ